MTKERKSIKAGSQLVYQAIYNQAGSIEKSLLEYVMNAVDAGASKIEINIENNGIDYSIFDNGNGFGDPNYSYEEKVKCIDEVFGYLGFDHGTDEENHRVYGKFGIGRAQLWSFSSNQWFTHNMTMEVDIKNRGIEYDIKKTDEFVDGCRIIGKFYDAIELNDMLFISNELSRMCAFAPIEVFFNGKKISRSLDELKSDLDTPNVRALLKASGDLLIYNQGVFVRAYPASTYGFGGIICSEVGHPFKVNTARNDIIQHKCELWKNVSEALEKKLTQKAERRRSGLTDDARIALIESLSGASKCEAKEIISKPLLKMQNNRYISIKDLLDGRKFTCLPAQRLDDNETKAAMLIQKEQGVTVIQSSFSEALGGDLTSIKENLSKISTEHLGKDGVLNVKSFYELSLEIDLDKLAISENKITKRQQCFLNVINNEKFLGELSGLAYAHGLTPTPEAVLEYTIKLGESNNIRVWGEGGDTIYLNEYRTFNKLNEKHYGCITNIIMMLLRQISADKSGFEEDDVEFYQNIHNLMVHSGEQIFDMSVTFIKDYAGSLVNEGFVVPHRLQRSLRNTQV